MNNVAYFEIQVANPPQAIEFYKNVFSWEFVKDEGIPVDYWRIQTQGMNGGLLKRPAATFGLFQVDENAA